MPLLVPDVVMINAGSNDCIQKFAIASIGPRMDNLLEYIWSASPGSTIILSTLLVNSDAFVEAQILETNAQFHELAKRKADSGKRIIFVDMHTKEGPCPDDLVDGTHPNDVGYYKMASLWRQGVHKAVSKGFCRGRL